MSDSDATAELANKIAVEIADHGPMPFSRWVERSLYEPGLGFYERGGGAGGRRGDFVTSVETGPLFAAVVGDRLDRAWNELGRPSPFVVAEAAAGVGTLWRGIRRAEPECFDALEWVLVERSETLRSAHRDLPPGRWRSDRDLPGWCHVVVANELLDNLVFDIACRSADGWRDLRVVGHAVDGFEFVVGQPLEAPVSGLATLGVGAEVPLAVGARQWVEEATASAEHLVVVFDYGAPTHELAVRGRDGWLRTYRGHVRGSDPLAAPGSCDITHDVPIDQLPGVPYVVDQASWLIENGIETRLEQARSSWNARAATGDLEAMFARSAITESAALTDPTGLGGFSVIEWRRKAG